MKVKEENKITRYYVLVKDDRVIAFQTAQIRYNNNKIEGWRNILFCAIKK